MTLTLKMAFAMCAKMLEELQQTMKLEPKTDLMHHSLWKLKTHAKQ
jgi:hypothetical protein